LYYERHGSSATDAPHRVLFIAGMNATFEAWSLQVEALTGGAYKRASPVQLVVFDNRGVGFSDAPPFTEALYNTTRLAQDALCVADAVGWSTFVIVAHSLGGMIAQRVVLLAPTRVRGLLMASSRIVGGFWQSLPTWTGLFQFVRMRLASTADEELEQTLHFLFPTEFLNMHCKERGDSMALFSYKTNRDWVFDMMRRRKGAKTANGSEGQLFAARSHSLTPAEVETLRQAHTSGRTHIVIVTGSEDLVVPPYHSKHAADQLCGGALTVFDKCGHAVSIQESEQFNRMILELCERVFATD
jgi:pimeloyl-ACP methyl ester carboxylesterase